MHNITGVLCSGIQYNNNTYGFGGKPISQWLRVCFLFFWLLQDVLIESSVYRGGGKNQNYTGVFFFIVS